MLRFHYAASNNGLSPLTDKVLNLFFSASSLVIAWAPLSLCYTGLSDILLS